MDIYYITLSQSYRPWSCCCCFGSTSFLLLIRSWCVDNTFRLGLF